VSARAVGLACALAFAPTAAHATPSEVVLVKRGGVLAYEELAEAFREGCRVHTQMVNLSDDHPKTTFGASQLVITVGQEAYDVVRAPAGHVIAALAFHVSDDALGPATTPAPELILQLLQTARPKLHSVGAVYGKRSEKEWRAAQAAAARLGINLVGVEVADGPEAVRALRKLVDQVQALWLPGDPDVVAPQVFQFALQLQIERGVLVAAATRQQVHSGALLAVDFNPRDEGRRAAELANRLLDGDAVNGANADRLDLLAGARMTVNREVARRLGVNLRALERLGARIE
jgi:ABC transporter substrate binding protein